MIYYLNNVRRKGKGGLHYDIEDTKFQTFLVASSELYSRYVFRADIAYDYTITQEQIEAKARVIFTLTTPQVCTIFYIILLI